ncbi:Peptidase S10, serine carboxypeptidase [Dillenia turbinata]|uniref:Carboxypeptidase n=1 Tax=Dillenia turbinata TaxID=194707 RepID=A0AAN8ZEX4_9MAGN
MGRCYFGGIFVAFLVWLVFGASVNGFPAEDLVVRLPGQPKVSFRQFAGYIDVDVKSGRSLFYYFVEAQNEPDRKPLTLWLNGGPGCSSVGGGAFTELGPFFPKGDGHGLRINSKSWNKASNLLFVESPVGVGWSYSNTTADYIRGDESTANDMHLFMLKWYEKFPAFKTRDLFLTGESYAGHYIPQLASVLLDHNKYSTTFKFHIKGVAIGNPLLRLDRDVPATYEFFWSHGMISDEIGLTIMNECDFDDYTFRSPHNVSKSCNDAINEANLIVGDYINNYDVILDVCYPSIVEQELRLRKLATKISVGVDVCMSYERRFYFNLPEVQKALHANRTSLPYGWSMCSGVLNYSDTDGNINILPLLKKIIQSNIPVWVFSGDQDSVVPLLGSRTLVRELAHDLKFKVTVPYGAWFHRGQVGGWQTEYGNLLTFATVRGAAHMVPYAQPARALHLFSSFVRGRRLPNDTRPSIDD